MPLFSQISPADMGADQTGKKVTVSTACMQGLTHSRYCLVPIAPLGSTSNSGFVSCDASMPSNVVGFCASAKHGTSTSNSSKSLESIIFRFPPNGPPKNVMLAPTERQGAFLPQSFSALEA